MPSRMTLWDSFNPRPCMRGDWPGQVSRLPRTRFQSTPLHEGRLGELLPLIRVMGFNPRPCMRGDVQYMIERAYRQKVSIHAPA